MHDGASVPRAESTMTNVLEGWRAGSPEVNLIENQCAVLKMHVEEELPISAEDIDVIIAVWENPVMSVLNSLRESKRSATPRGIVSIIKSPDLVRRFFPRKIGFKFFWIVDGHLSLGNTLHSSARPPKRVR